MRFVRQCGDDWRDWVTLFLHTLGFKPGMDLKHKLMEMRTPFALDLNAVEKQVHQHGFTAPNAAPKIKSACRVGFTSQETPKIATARFSCLKLALHFGQCGYRGCLVGVRP